VELRRADHERVRAVIGLGDRPAADVAGLGVGDERAHEGVDQLGVAGAGDDHEGQAGNPDADRQVRAPPAELLEQDVLLEAAEAEAAQLDGDHRSVVAEAIGVAQRAPERRALRDHLGRVSQTVECYGGRAEHLGGGEAVRRLAERRLLGGQVQVEVAVHARVPQHIPRQRRRRRGAILCRRRVAGVRTWGRDFRRVGKPPTRATRTHTDGRAGS